MLQNDIKKNKNKLNNWSDRGSLLPSYYEMIIMKTFTDSEKIRQTQVYEPNSHTHVELQCN